MLVAVNVDRDGQLANGVVGNVGWVAPGAGERTGGIASPVQPCDHDNAGCTGCSNGTDQLVIPGVLDPSARAAIDDAGPSEAMRLIEQVEENPGTVLECTGNRGPKGRRVILIGHVCLTVRRLTSGGTPLKREDHGQSSRIEVLNILGDSDSIVRSAELGRRHVDAQPTILVQWEPDRIDVPALHGADRGRRIAVGRVEDPTTLDALGFRPGVVDTEQTDGILVLVDQVVARHSDDWARCGDICSYTPGRADWSLRCNQLRGR